MKRIPGQGEGGTDLAESGAGVLGDVAVDVLFLFGREAAFASGPVVEVFDGPQAVALANEFLDEPQGDAKRSAICRRVASPLS